ncbi:hypothetical protein HMPREF1990_01620, partial [Porphyromonas gingivalis W4087]
QLSTFFSTRQTKKFSNQNEKILRPRFAELYSAKFTNEKACKMSMPPLADFVSEVVESFVRGFGHLNQTA